MANRGENLVYKHPEDNWFDARVNIYCKLSNLTVIRDAMDTVGMLRRWEQGVFRQFLTMDKELFSGQRAVRFGKEEFLLVTGLRFGPMPASVNSLPKAAPGSVHHQYFGGSPTSLKDVLGRLSTEGFDEAEDVIKLGYVYVLSHIMLGREYRWKVPDWIWGLVEDIAAFEAFPWGTYIYSVTIYWLGKALNDRTNGRKQNRNYSTEQDLGYNVYGFPWALMYWAMEAIPVLTSKVGKRRRGRRGHGMPRLTRWYCRKKPPRLEEKFTDEMEAYTTLTPTAEERLQEYYRQFDPLAVVGPELHKHGGYDPENQGGRRERGHDNELRSFIESRFQQIDLKIDKLLADQVHAPVPPIPVPTVPPVPVGPVPTVPAAPQPTWSAGYTPTWSAGYTRSYAESSMRRYDMEETGEQQLNDEQQLDDDQDDQQLDDEQDEQHVDDEQDEQRAEDEHDEERAEDEHQIDEQQAEDEQQVDEQQVDNQNDEGNMRRRSQRIKKLETGIQHEQQVENELDDEQQGAENQKDEEENKVRRSKRLKKLTAVVQTPFTVPRLVKNMVYVRKNSRKC